MTNNNPQDIFKGLTRSMFMESLQKVLESRTTVQLPTGLNKLTTTGNCTTVDVDQLLKDYDDLISPTFKAWYAKRFYALGHERVQILAAQARTDGKNPAKLFSFLLKKA